MYLAKVAMDIVAKHVAADKDGVRIAELDEMTYREAALVPTAPDRFLACRANRRQAGPWLLHHGRYRPAQPEAKDLLYNALGINAELLIDHAWGWEPRKSLDQRLSTGTSSLSSGQVLAEAYTLRTES